MAVTIGENRATPPIKSPNFLSTTAHHQNTQEKVETRAIFWYGVILIWIATWQ